MKYLHHEQPGTHLQDTLEALPQTISLAPATVEIGDDRLDVHSHRGCPLCSEEALPERCPGFRLDWLC